MRFILFVFASLWLVLPGQANATDSNDCGTGANSDKGIRSCTSIINNGGRKERESAYFNRGLAYQTRGDYDRAIADYDQVIGLNPEAGHAYNNRGVAYNAKGNYDRAMADYDQAISLNPQNGKAYNNRGVAYQRKGDHNRAVADYDQAIRLNPELAKAYDNRGNAHLHQGDLSRAIADYDQAIRLSPKSADVYYNRGNAYLKQGDLSRAIADYDQAIRRNPKSAYAYYNRGNAYQQKGDLDRAIANYDQALRQNPRSANAYNNRGNAYQKKGDLDRAIADYDQALRINPNLPDVADIRRKAIAQVESRPITEVQRPAWVVAPAAHIGKRLALVIGNGDYKTVNALRNPKNDAAAVAGELARLGFEVMVSYDLDAVSMRRSLAEFEDKVIGADWALVYYAGHGMELEGHNWLIPVDARLAKSSDVADETVPLDRVLDRVRAAKKLRIVILDACRNNPFVSRMVIINGQSRGLQRGLAKIEPEHGEVIFFAARDGSLADDGAGEHSPFTAALLKHLSEEGLELGRFFRKVTSTVLKSTAHRQEPFVYGRLPDEDFYFVPPNVTSGLPAL
jgi:tetratricopeptide (TPR) repeat protein